MRNLPDIAISAVDGTTNPSSDWLPADQWFAFSATILGTGTIAGTLKAQVSNDGPATAQSAIAGFDLPTATVALAALKGVIPFFNSAYGWVRFVFTTSGGAGNVTVKVKASGF